MSLRTLVRPLAVALVVAVLGAPAATAGASSTKATAPRKVSAWLPWWDQERGYASFVNNADLYRSVSPFWYEMRSATEVARYPGAGDATIVTGIRSRGVQIIPTVSNDFDGARVSAMLSTTSSRTSHVQALTNLAVGAGFDGLDIDYENLLAGDRDRFSAFVAELGASLRAAGRILSVTVHPKTSEPGAWSGPQAQDYAAIGAAADRVRVMAYDYHWATSTAGAIAPVWWVDQVAAFAASKIAPSKLELGMPLYGYDWVGSNGEGVTWSTATSRMQAAGAPRRWSSTDGAPWFTYESNGASHQVWYEDADSVAAKLPIVNRYGLAGAAFWRLGGEDPAVWNRVRAALGGDTSAPSAPTNLVATASQRAVDLRWNGSSDAGSGVASYWIYRGASRDGSYAKVGATTATTWRNTGLSRRTAYWYYVVAVDAAGNRSVPSSRIRALTG